MPGTVHGRETVNTTELVLGLMLGVSRSITSAHDTMRRGEWAKKSFSGSTLKGKTLGIVGFGSVGQEASALNCFFLCASLVFRSCVVHNTFLLFWCCRAVCSCRGGLHFATPGDQ